MSFIQPAESPVEQYSLAVAIFDFLPVLATAVGMQFLGRAIARQHPPLATAARFAALLIPAGGLCKASWKLLLALGQPPMDWLENLLFICMAPGFVVMAYGLHHAGQAWLAGATAPESRMQAHRLLLWLGLTGGGAILAAALWPASRWWFVWLLAATTVASIALAANAIYLSRRGGWGWPVGACFGYNVLATLAMGSLARLPPGESTAWIQEGVNLSAQLALAVGAWHLSRRMHTPFTEANPR